MKRKTIATLIVLVGIATAAFVFAPVVYSPIKVEYICEVGTCSGSGFILTAAYESPSCVVLGIGVGHDNWTAPVDHWTYYIGCPPKVESLP